uniref:DNA-directed RNA polymerase n=1 Tax=Dolichandra cynanchoides TaxID=353977 RepID=A0A2P1G9Y5_9LAMI|nr:RNA polymerase alpha subunit [Dolichandra cynanchoides]AVM81764.1 RNA polymerase alpha subunit [Dolichandra cynanchoides]
MIRDKITAFTQIPQWRCIESIEYDKLLHYGRFVLAPLREGQGDTIGVAMRRALLGETEATWITRVKSKNVPHDPHEYSTVTGIKEPIYDIVFNLNKIVLRSNLHGNALGCICVRDPRAVTAQDIILPHYIKIVDNTQHIATLTEPMDLCIELEIERNSGFCQKQAYTLLEGAYSTGAAFMPVQNANYTIHTFRNGNEKQEILFLEIWTNGGLTPKEALHQASRKLINLVIAFLRQEEENLEKEDKQDTCTLHVAPVTISDKWDKLRKKKTKLALKSIFIDQFEFSSKVYNCLKKANIHTLFDLLNNSQEDLMKIDHFRLEDGKHLFFIIEKYFEFDLPKDVFY